MEGESGTVVIRLRATAPYCQSQGDGARAARFVCPATHNRKWRMLVGSFVREAEAVPSCCALHPLRPLSGPRVARIVCHAIWRMLVGSFVREAEAAPSCGALHPLRPLGGPRVARIVCHAIWRMLVGSFVREAEAAPSCGALHPLRPLGGPRVLQTAAPKISPCFCRWQRSKF